MGFIEIYVWAMVITTIASVRAHYAHDIEEWAVASLAGAIWPVVVTARIVRRIKGAVS
jgi:hypothetical protein